MVNRTNVNDAFFLGDWILNDDYLRDANAAAEDDRLHGREHWSIYAVINEGLSVNNGTNPDTFMVRAGIARDMDKYLIYVPVDVDNVACVDTTGGPNYVAIRHIWAYAGARAAIKTASAYNSQRADSYEVNVSGIAQTEAAGWVRLCVATKSGGVWSYNFNRPYRSRFGQYGLVSWTFFYLGVVPVGPVLMLHQGVPYELWTCPVDALLCKMTIAARVVGAGITTATARVAGAATALNVALPGAALGPTTNFSPAGAAGLIDQPVHVQIGAAGGGATDAAVTLTGYIIRGLA